MAGLVRQGWDRYHEVSDHDLAGTTMRECREALQADEDGGSGDAARSAASISRHSLVRCGTNRYHD